MVASSPDRPAASRTLQNHGLTGTTFNVGQGAASRVTSENEWPVSPMQAAFPFSSAAPASWAHMPRNEKKLQKMARQSLLHELWQEQQRTHEIAVDWYEYAVFFFLFFILRRMGKNKALAHHTSTYFHTRRVSI